MSQTALHDRKYLEYYICCLKTFTVDATFIDICYSMYTHYYRRWRQKPTTSQTLTFWFAFISRYYRYSPFQEIVTKLLNIFFQWLHLLPSLLCKNCYNNMNKFIPRHCNMTLPMTESSTQICNFLYSTSKTFWSKFI